MSKVICLSCGGEMRDGRWARWHKRRCPDVGVLAENWEQRDGRWFLKGTDREYHVMAPHR